ncbi:hypothetical protein [Kitasatospora sp. NBC_01539]|uniref:hypothetical protein n=1 Tax=Kitasatospora sp. NBC_01539 TaxID=2903577 RepID=UPI003860128C
MRISRLRASRLRKAAVRTALVCTAAVTAPATSGTDATALPGGITAARLTRSQPSRHTGASASAGYSARPTFLSDGNLVLHDTDGRPTRADGTCNQSVGNRDHCTT